MQQLEIPATCRENQLWGARGGERHIAFGNGAHWKSLGGWEKCGIKTWGWGESLYNRFKRKCPTHTNRQETNQANSQLKWITFKTGLHRKYHRDILGFSEYPFRFTGSPNVFKNGLVFFPILVYGTELQETHTVLCAMWVLADQPLNTGASWKGEGNPGMWTRPAEHSTPASCSAGITSLKQAVKVQLFHNPQNPRKTKTKA